jgi:hypothetical protein
MESSSRQAKLNHNAREKPNSLTGSKAGTQMYRVPKKCSGSFPPGSALIGWFSTRSTMHFVAVGCGMDEFAMGFPRKALRLGPRVRGDDTLCIRRALGLGGSSFLARLPRGDLRDDDGAAQVLKARSCL